MADTIYCRGAIALPESAWTATAEPAPDTPPLTGESKADVAVVGAGYTGLSTALHLAEAGVEVVVLDAGEPGFGASGRNGGQVVPGLKHDPDTLIATFGDNRGRALVDFAGGTATRTFELIERHGIDCDARPTGWIQPAPNETKLKLLESRARQWQRAADLDVRILDKRDAARLIGTDHYAGGWIDPRGGTVQPLAFARGLARAAIRHGARIHARSLVTGLERDGGGWRVATESGAVKAKRVVLATNGYTGALWPRLRQTVLPATSVQTATEPLPPHVRETVLPAGMPVSDARRILAYMRYDPDGRFCIGGRGSFGQGQPAHYFRRLQRLAVRLFPALQEVSWEFEWGGTVAITVDGYPHLHRLDDTVYAALGYNGRGVAMATQMGRLLAEMCRGAPDDALPFPVTEPKPLPFHAFRRPGMEVAGAWYRTLDRLGW